MKKILLLIFIQCLLFACGSKNGAKPESLISQNAWEVTQFTDPEGNRIPNSSLNSDAIRIFGMHFEFKSNGEVRGVDAESKTIIQRGTWKFIDNETSVNINLPGLNYDFKIIILKTGMLTLQAPTENFISNVGAIVNMEFQPAKQ